MDVSTKLRYLGTPPDPKTLRFIVFCTFISMYFEH